MGCWPWGLKKMNGPDRWQSICMDDWASIIYTSGTTGQGKGAILTHRSFSTRLYHTMETFSRTGISVTEEDVCLSFLPLSHIFDRGCSQMLAVYAGACIAYGDKPATILQDMQKYQPTWFSCVPRLYERIYITIQEQMAASPVKKFIFNKALAVGKKVLAHRTDSHGRINMAPDFDVAARLPMGLRMTHAMSEKIFSRIRSLFGSRLKFSFSAGAGISAELSTMFYIKDTTDDETELFFSVFSVTPVANKAYSYFQGFQDVTGGFCRQLPMYRNTAPIARHVTTTLMKNPTTGMFPSSINPA